MGYLQGLESVLLPESIPRLEKRVISGKLKQSGKRKKMRKPGPVQPGISAETPVDPLVIVLTESNKDISQTLEFLLGNVEPHAGYSNPEYGLAMKPTVGYLNK